MLFAPNQNPHPVSDAAERARLRRALVEWRTSEAEEPQLLRSFVPVPGRQPYEPHPTKVGLFVRNVVDLGGLVSPVLSGIGLLRDMWPSTPSIRWSQTYEAADMTTLRKAGYKLFLTPEMVQDMNDFCMEPFSIKNIQTAAEIQAAARLFDKYFTPDMAFLSLLVSFEWPDKGTYDMTSRKLYSAKPVGGMAGGWDGAYWGVTQFGASAFLDVRRFCGRVGLQLPPVRSTNLGHQLVAGYVYGLINQSILIKNGFKEPINAHWLYLAHNQGAGAVLKRRIPRTWYAAQSRSVQALLDQYRFSLI